MTARLPSTAPVPATSGLPRLLLGAGQDGTWAGHRRRHGPVPYRGGRRLLIDTLDEAGLTGRGGAGLPDRAEMAGGRQRPRPGCRRRQRRRG